MFKAEVELHEAINRLGLDSDKKDLLPDLLGTIVTSVHVTLNSRRYLAPQFSCSGPLPWYFW